MGLRKAIAAERGQASACPESLSPRTADGYLFWSLVQFEKAIQAAGELQTLKFDRVDDPVVLRRTSMPR